MKRTFELNGRIFYTMMDMARELGVARIYPKDFAKYGIKELDGVTVDKVAISDVKVDKTDSPDVKVDTAVKPKTVKSTKVVKTDKSAKVDTLQDYAIFLRRKTLDELVALCKAEGVDTCDSISFEPIRKMHLVMNLKEKKFPGERLETRKPTAFRKIHFDVLYTTAENMNLEYRKSDNEAITRMWLTKALVEAGVHPEDLIPSEEGSVESKDGVK